MTTPRLFVLLGSIYALAAQTPNDAHFEVASVKRSAPWDGGTGMASLRLPSWEGGPGTASPTRLTIRNTTPSGLIGGAYGLLPFQFEGPPTAMNQSGISADKVDIDATLSAGTTKQQSLLMLQNLLEERFHLKVHWENREGTVYDLVVGRSGHKLKKSPPEPAGPSDPDGRSKSAQGTVQSGRVAITMRANTVECKFLAYSMQELARTLSGQVKSPVRDETGLTGKYDIVLEYQPTFAAASVEEAPSDSSPDIFGAVQTQLGLKLVRRKGQVKVLVVEHMDKVPVEN